MEHPSHRVGRNGRRYRKKPVGARRSQAKAQPGDLLEKYLVHAHIGVAHLDRTYRVVWVNEAFARLVNHTMQELIGGNFLDLFPDDQLLTIFEHVLTSASPQTLFGRPLPPLLGLPAPTYWDLSVQPYHSGRQLQPDGLLLVLNDVTTRERAMQEFEQAQALFVHLFESSPDANLLINQHGEIMAANHQAEVLFGYRRNELVGRAIEVLMPPEFREKHVQHRGLFWHNMQKRPMGAGLELFGLRKNGSTFPVDITLSPLSTEQGPVVLAVVHDISLRMANQKALQVQTGLVQLLQQITAAANQSISAELAFQTALDRICAYLGWPVGHAYRIDSDGNGTPMSIWNAQFPAELQAFRESTEQIIFQPGVGLIGQVQVSGRPLWLTNPEVRPNFRRRDEVRTAGLKTAVGVPVIAGSEVVAVLEFFTSELIEPDLDMIEVLPHVGMQLGRVIERQRSEEALNEHAAQLRAVVSNLPVILMVLDMHGQIMLMDGRGLHSVGREPGELVGTSIFDRLQANPAAQEAVRRALKGQEMHVEFQSEQGFIYETFLLPYFDAGDAQEGVIALSLDVTQRKQMEADLEEIKHLLMASVENERARLAQQLHDGPLQDLYGVFYQVQEVKDQLPSETQDTLETALETIRSVNSTLRFICGELRPTTLAHLGLRMAIRSHSERLQERYPLTIHLDMEEDAQQLDPNQRLPLYRIYQVLISNVIRHANARHAWVRLRLQPDQVLLEVQDNGQGFEKPANWVELVRQGHFGLTGAQERAEALGGTLEIISQPGGGTLARVSVPRSIE